MASTTIEEKVQKLITQAIEDLGYELYDVEYLKEGKDYQQILKYYYQNIEISKI